MPKRITIALLFCFSFPALAQESGIERDIAMDWSRLLNAYERIDKNISIADFISSSSLMFADQMSGKSKGNVYFCVQQYRTERSVLAPLRDQSTARSAKSYSAFGQDKGASAIFLDSELPLANDLLSTAERIRSSSFRCLSQNGIRVDILYDTYRDLYEKNDG